VLYREVVEAWLDGRARVVADALGGTLLLEPVIRDGEAAAVLCLRYGAGTTPPSRRQSAAVRLLAVEAAVAIERAEHAAQVRMSDRFEVARRLARDLHDSVSQDVALSSLYAHTAMKALDGGDTEEARKILDEAANQLTRAQDDLRAVMRSLRQGHRLDGAATLPELIDALAAEHERRAGAPVLVARDASEWVRIAPEVADAIYFAVREALHNALKHAKGAGVRIELHADDDEVRAAVRDDGPGFDPSDTPHGCWGLIGMRERAERLGGHVDVSSRPGYGTTVAVTLPRAGASMPVSG
jgi:signal transduction histidine kinase